MKKIAAFLIIVLTISGCSFDVQVITPAPVVQTPPTVTPITPSPVPAQPSIFVPTTTEPVFYNAFVSRDAAEANKETRFPASVEQVNAVWQYQNMREGLTIKRDWYLDGALWLEREEPWDFATFGKSGTMQGISIHDFDIGLPSGRYRLIISIDGVAQPIGKPIPEGTAETYLEFEILPVIEATSPDGQLIVTSHLNRLVLTDPQGNQSDLIGGREILSVAWLDNQHLLYVDRDRSGQVSDLLVGIRDELWIVDVVTRESQSLYQSDTALGLMGGLYVSPNRNYIAGVEGSGYGDACLLDSQVIFFEVAYDYKSVNVIKQRQFTGLPTTAEGVLYPPIVGTWQNNTQYMITLNATCSANPSLTGLYLFNLLNLTASQDVPVTTPFLAGDLGWGEVHGMVTNAVTGQAIVGATITCEHSSYTSPAQCSGSAVTSTPGIYIFEKIFFHDTDTIKLTASAPGYQPQEFTQSSFTTNDLMVNFSLTPLP